MVLLFPFLAQRASPSGGVSPRSNRSIQRRSSASSGARVSRSGRCRHVSHSAWRPAPARDARVVARQQNRRHSRALELLGPRVLRRLQQPARERLALGRAFRRPARRAAAASPRRSRPARAARRRSARSRRSTAPRRPSPSLTRSSTPSYRPARRIRCAARASSAATSCVNRRPRGSIRTRASRRRAQRRDRREEGLRLQHHAAAAAELIVVGDPVPTLRVVSEIDHPDVNEPPRARAAQDRLGDDRLHHPRKQRHDVDAHPRLALQLEQSLRRPDHDPPRLDVDLDHDLGHRRDQMLAPGATHHPQVVGRRRLDAAHLADGAAVLGRPPRTRPAATGRRGRAAAAAPAPGAAPPAVRPARPPPRPSRSRPPTAARPRPAAAPPITRRTVRIVGAPRPTARTRPAPWNRSGWSVCGVTRISPRSPCGRVTSPMTTRSPAPLTGRPRPRPPWRPPRSASSRCWRAGRPC